MKAKAFSWRIYFVFLIVIILGLLIGLKLFFLQVINHQFYQALAQDQHQIYQQITPQRGEIFIQDKYTQKLFPIAVNHQQKMLYAVPRRLQESPENLALSLSEILNMPKEEILGRLVKKDDPYEPIKHKLTDQEISAIEALDSPGLGLLNENSRYYPGQTLASQTIGFLGYESQEQKGQYGIEAYYDQALTGQEGVFEGEKDTAGRWINLTSKKIVPAVDGVDLVLTLDQNIQFMIEEKLTDLIDKWQAEEGVIIVMEPQTGAIRGLANWPNFDLNQYSQVKDFDVFLNRAVHKLYEPGSVFKPIVVAAALQEGKISVQETYVDQGVAIVSGRQIHNANNKSYGVQTMSQVLEKSLNTGAIYIQQKLGDELFLDYIQRFGLDKKTDVDLASERQGNISNLLTGRPINFATASFGQGIAVTPLELIAGIGALANQGQLMRPFLVQTQITPDGQKIETQPQVREQAVSAQTAQVLTQMLVNSVDQGVARQGKVSGYQIAGKTGTAQIPNPEGGYFEYETLHSFVGYGPADNTCFIVLIMLSKPQGVRFASQGIAPAFKDIAEYLLDYYEIMPND